MCVCVNPGDGWGLDAGHVDGWFSFNNAWHSKPLEPFSSVTLTQHQKYASAHLCTTNSTTQRIQTAAEAVAVSLAAIPDTQPPVLLLLLHRACALLPTPSLPTPLQITLAAVGGAASCQEAERVLLLLLLVALEGAAATPAPTRAAQQTAHGSSTHRQRTTAAHTDSMLSGCWQLISPFRSRCCALGVQTSSRLLVDCSLLHRTCAPPLSTPAAHMCIWLSNAPVVAQQQAAVRQAAPWVAVGAGACLVGAHQQAPWGMG